MFINWSVWLLKGKSAGIPGAMKLKQNYQSKFFKNKSKQNAKQYKTSSATGGLNIAWSEPASHAQWAYWLLRNHQHE